MQTNPITVRGEGAGNPPEELELLRRQVNFLIQSNSAQTENGAYSAAGCAQATTTTQAKTTATASYTVNGAFKTKGATDNLWTLTGAVVPVSSFQKYLLCLNAAGTASIIECVASTPASATTPAATLVTLPSYQSFTVATIGTLTIATDATHPFTPGTTALNATGITATFIDGFDIGLANPALIKTFDPTGPG